MRKLLNIVLTICGLAIIWLVGYFALAFIASGLLTIGAVGPDGIAWVAERRIIIFGLPSTVMTIMSFVAMKS